MMRKSPMRTVLNSLLVLLSLTVIGCVSSVSSPDPSENVMQYRTNIVEVNGSKISYRELGKGVPLILLQRFRGSLNDWDPALITALSKSNRVIIFDSLGVGESEGKIPQALEGAAGFVVAFMDSLNIKQANILGWSLGGMTAQVLAIKYPNRVEKLVLAGTTPPAAIEEVKLASKEWTAIATKPNNSAEDMAYLFYTESIAGLKAAEESQQRFEKLDKHGVETKTSPAIIMPQAIGARGYIANNGNWYEQLRNIDLPVLIANGDSDKAFPVINSIVLHRQIPNSKLVIYPDAGHAFLFQYANQFSNHLNEFLRSR